ncbi:tannase and feruloyl esterase [Marasmius fiardii PR-910]|nr:tannase and feruloyl esterase [Marasmius fiardii PR-910]
MQVETSSSSNIRMEAWLPRNWTGRFLSTGNGGLQGCIQYPDLTYATSLGFATVGANGGHNGSSGAPFENRPEVLADFAFRSIHTNVVIGKEITQRFYGQQHKKSYYLGCSTGGRQGLKSVEDFPEDFDGVVAGAPAANFNALVAKDASQPTSIPTELWTTLIHSDIISQCDEIDGVKDGIIEAPSLWSYDPSGLLCRNSSEDLRTIPGLGWKTLIYPRAQPGGEDGLTMMVSGQLFGLTYVIYNSSFDPTTLTLSDYQVAIDRDPFNISTFKGDLRSFAAGGGKLLTYHGQQDGMISPLMSEVYYDHAREVSGELDSYYRFFRISGMGHCTGGPGAHQIGQVSSNGTRTEPEENVLTAMVRWVE